MVFGVIAGGLLVLNVAQAWLNQTTKVKLREGLVCDLFDEWLKPRRAFHLVNAGEMGTNPDQRIHEDARHLTELTTDLGIGLLQSSLLLGSFIGVLWILSQNVTFHVSGRSFGIPGYMVWCALLYAGTASWLSWRVGRPLIQLNSERYAREADLRFALVRLNEHSDSVALYGGEQDEKRRLTAELEERSPRDAADRQRDHATYLDHGRLRLVHDYRADRSCISGILRRRSFLRRADDGRRRLYSGAAGPAVVYR